MGQDIRRIMVLIPSLNPNEKLPRLVTDLGGQGFAHIVVIDDGSKSECQPIFDQLRQMDHCTVLVHPVNRGKGAGLKTGLQYFMDNRETLGLEGVVTADSDGQHLPQDIVRVAQALLENPDHIILGTRDFDDPDVPPKSRGGNKLTTRVFRVLHGRTIHDFMTGLRGLPASWMTECMACKGERFEFEVNMLIAAVRQGVPTDELTIQTVYFDANKETTFRPVRDSLHIYKVIFASFLRFSCSSLFCALLDWGLFCLLLAFVFGFLEKSAGIWAATATARVLSSLCNYDLNRTVVFRSTANPRRSLLRYFILVVCQMACSAALVAGLHALTGFAPWALKLVVDVVLFFLSYRIQQRWVFR